jgi:GT2 family glycosyltransferase
MPDNRHSPEIDVSIILVNYNSGELLKNCIESLQSNLEIKSEIIVYDNASSDTSISILEGMLQEPAELKIIRGKENLGFAKANHAAVQYAKGKYYHFLNPDMLINRALNADYRAMIAHTAPEIWVTRLTDADGILQKNKHVIARLGNIIRFLLRSENVAYWNIGASIIIHRDAYQRMGGWPADYFMYAEDIDFFWTAYKHNIPVNYLSTSLIHIGKGITHKIWNDEQRATIIEKSFRTFYRKYHAGWEYLIIRPVQLGYMLFNEPSSFPLYAKVFFKNLFKI